MKKSKTYAAGTIMCALVISANPFSATAQNTFQSLYKTDNDKDLLTTVRTIESISSNHYLQVGCAVDNTGAGSSYSTLSRVDENGLLIWSREWYANVGNQSWDIIEAANNDYVISGHTSESASWTTFWDDFTLTRVAPTGTLVWTKRYGATNRGRCYGLVEDPANNDLFMSGYSNTTNASGFTGTSDDFNITKVNSTGVVQWAKEYGGAQSDRGGTITMGYNPNEVLVCGNTFSWGAGSADGYLLAADKNTGAHLWSKAYGGPQFDEAFLEPISSNRYMCTGTTYSWGIGGADIWLMMLDQNGNLIWSKTYGTVNNEYSYDVIEALDGSGLIVTAFTDVGPHGASDIVVFKIDHVGDILWSYAYGGELNDYSYSLDHCTDDGGFIISAETESYHYRESSRLLLKIAEDGAVCNCDNVPFELEPTTPTVSVDPITPYIETHAPITVTTPNFGTVTTERRALCRSDLSGVSLRPTGGANGVDVNPIGLHSPIGNMGGQETSDFPYTDPVEDIERHNEEFLFDVRSTMLDNQFDVFGELDVTRKKSIVKVTSLSGLVTLERKFKSNPLRVDLSDQPTGIYIVTMENDGVIVGSTKVSVVN